MNPDESAELLSRLRDIHGAPEAPFWPPAPGWWVVAFLLLLVLGWGVRLGVLRWRAHRRRRVVLERLAGLRERNDPATAPQAWLADVNRLLKVVAMRAFPEASAGSLKGADWVGFLGGDSEPDAFEVLAEGPYRPHPVFDPDAVERAAENWIRRHG